MPMKGEIKCTQCKPCCMLKQISKFNSKTNTNMSRSIELLTCLCKNIMLCVPRKYITRGALKVVLSRAANLPQNLFWWL
jgi:hypothetical protein